MEKHVSISEKDEWFDADWQALELLEKLPERIKGEKKLSDKAKKDALDAVECLNSYLMSKRFGASIKRVGAAQAQLMEHLGIKNPFKKD
jgi:hypothetical protein